MHQIKAKKQAYTLLYIENNGWTLHTHSLLREPLHLLRFLQHHIPEDERGIRGRSLQGNEMELRAEETERVSTIYLGGGTPSQLTSQQLLQIFEGISQHYGSCMVRDMEVTMECNPDDITPTLCHTLSQLPINRISMGAQTFSDERLRFLHRRHNAREVENAIHLLREAGIGNISIDLMFGFPNETIQEWQQDIEHAISLNAEHLSAYSLMYEEGTTLYRLLQQEKIKETDEDTYLRMYEMLIDKMTAAGYEHYEISNFAKPGFRSRATTAVTGMKCPTSDWELLPTHTDASLR